MSIVDIYQLVHHMCKFTKQLPGFLLNSTSVKTSSAHFLMHPDETCVVNSDLGQRICVTGFPPAGGFRVVDASMTD